MADIRIGNIKSFAKTGDRVTVYFENGKSGKFIASNDLTSTKVAVIGDRAFSGDVARQELVVNTKLFRSKTNYQDDDKDYPWAYLFEVNDFAAFTGASGSVINYTDTCWELDDAEGFIRALGDGGGRYKTQPASAPLFQRHEHRIEVIYRGGDLRRNVSRSRDYGIPVGGAITYDAVRGDGVFYPTSVESEDQTYYDPNKLVEVKILPDSQYQIHEDIAGDDSYAIIWRGGDGSPELVSVGNSTGETDRYRSHTDINNPIQVQQEIDLINDLNNSGYIAPSWTIPVHTFNNTTFTGQQIIDGLATSPYSQITYNLESTTGFNAPSVDEYMYAIGDTYPNVIYTAKLKMVPRVGRSPGVKKIYAQVRDNKKVLLHEIPSFEPWDGYISKLPNDEIQVVLKCAKKFHSTDGITNLYSNISSNIYTPSIPFGFYYREWSQIRVYNLDRDGEIISLQISNNSETDLNPGNTPDAIAIDPTNWQIDWLNNYKDLRATSLRTDNIFAQPGSLFRVAQTYKPSTQINMLIDNQMDLKSALRYKAGEAVAPYWKGIPNTGILRPLIEVITCGSLTNKGFVYVNPNDLLDPRVVMSSPGLSHLIALPSPNYSIMSALINDSQSQKRYYLCPDSQYQNGTFTLGASVQKQTLFPKLDLTADDIGGIEIPSSLIYGQYNNLPLEDVIEETSALRRFGLRAIAFLE